MSTVATGAQTRYLTVRPHSHLEGTVTVGGSTAMALGLLATAGALRWKVKITNVPWAGDVESMLAVLPHAGMHTFSPVGESGSLVCWPASCVRGSQSGAGVMPRVFPEVSYLVPAMLASRGRARLPWPDDEQDDLVAQLQVYEEAFGDAVVRGDDGYQVTAASPVPAVAVRLPVRWPGATVTTVLRAAAARTRLALTNPYWGPETTSVLEALRGCGFGVQAAQDELWLSPPAHEASGSLEWQVPGDPVEAAVLACAVAASGGSARIDGVYGPHLQAAVGVLTRAGLHLTLEDRSLRVYPTDFREVAGLRVTTSLSPGGLAPAFLPPLTALALRFPGVHLLQDELQTETMNALLKELERFGVRVEVLSATVRRLTVSHPSGHTWMEARSPAVGSALMVAALAAPASSVIKGMDAVYRRYRALPGKLAFLGADLVETSQ
ncbi:UDP-N-acetylglucosamine 1-carboxyvinyltransferase [Streptomyces mobaraensis]|uniref:UDP-N-acetylglucosamine 1-carboxyvinyltransferase n=1 Tax=Streptomyces mobaraensis TaxID=35621 RepID=A0A5N5W2N7_STRMB|nr:UDP-N-acetylglucosamine 1-carboxyvinyltransferase [Streptomyces mobaraensis]KAB7835518.1 UDP-N-acetylglucosamine 1-carboxyvinyltransferase [Streptomyces mobaraensis]